jgi:hypothetical protein
VTPALIAIALQATRLSTAEGMLALVSTD